MHFIVNVLVNKDGHIDHVPYFDKHPPELISVISRVDTTILAIYIENSLQEEVKDYIVYQTIGGRSTAWNIGQSYSTGVQGVDSFLSPFLVSFWYVNLVAIPSDNLLSKVYKIN